MIAFAWTAKSSQILGFLSSSSLARGVDKQITNHNKTPAMEEMEIEGTTLKGPDSSDGKNGRRSFLKGLTEMEIMEEFPLLSNWNGFKYWTGFIKGSAMLLRISITVPQFPRCGGCVIQGDADSFRVLEKLGSVIDKFTKQNRPVVDLLRQFKKAITNEEEKTSSSVADSTRFSNPDFFLAICEELDNIGVENVEEASKDLANVSLKYVILGEKHVIRFKIPKNYPQGSLSVLVDLPPLSAEETWPLQLSAAYQKFQLEVEKYIPFWRVVDELDSQCRIIDPVQPKRGDLHRRIAINQSVVVTVVFRPLRPKAIPDIRFSGPDKSVEELEARLDKHCSEWSEDRSALENLEDILKVEFLLKESKEVQDEDNIEDLCVICYTYEFEENIPDITCECGSIYHDRCLCDLVANDLYAAKHRRGTVDCPSCGLELKVLKMGTKVGWAV